MNDTLKKIAKYQKDRKERDRDMVFIVEGMTLLSEAPRDSIRILVTSESFLSEDRNRADFQKLLSEVLDVRQYKVSDADFKKLSDTVTPRGILAVLKRPQYVPEDVIRSDGLYVVTERLQDPGNLGTILRSMEAAGATALFADANTVDFYHPKTVRSTMGSIFRVPVLTADLRELFRVFRGKGIRTYAAALDGSTDYTESDYRKGTAFLIGNEAKGLSGATIQSSDERIRIPMEGRVESLNAAMAGTVLLFEAKRQRGIK